MEEVCMAMRRATAHNPLETRSQTFEHRIAKFHAVMCVHFEFVVATMPEGAVGSDGPDDEFLRYGSDMMSPRFVRVSAAASRYVLKRRSVEGGSREIPYPPPASSTQSFPPGRRDGGGKPTRKREGIDEDSRHFRVRDHDHGRLQVSLPVAFPLARILHGLHVSGVVQELILCALDHHRLSNG